MKSFLCNALRRHCEEGVLPDEAISNIVTEIASGKVQVRPRNDAEERLIDVQP